jgi:hypothetical protein
VKNNLFFKRHHITDYSGLPVISCKWKTVNREEIEDLNNVQSNFYQTNMYSPIGFYKPMSLLINLKSICKDEKQIY